MAKTLTTDLKNWLKGGDKTYGDLGRLFGYKSQWAVIALLMAPAALPLPTGGVTHVLEIITLAVAIRLIVGKTKLWLPKKWLSKSISKNLRSKVLPKLASLEKLSRPRYSNLTTNPAYLKFGGLLVLIFTLAALLAPPFTGLDTLPALAVVLISMSIILNDMLFFIIAIIFGFAGIGLEISIGSLAWHLLG